MGDRNGLKSYAVYRITNLVNGKKYIGKTANVGKRLTEHWREARQDCQYVLHRAIRSAGRESFHAEVVARFDTDQEAMAHEVERIRIEGTMVPAGYNMTVGGEGAEGVVVSVETRAKLSAAGKGRKVNAATLEAVRRPRSAETRARMSDAKRGVKRAPFSEEHRKRLGDVSRGRKQSHEQVAQRAEWHRGRKRDEAARANMRAGWTPEARARAAESARIREAKKRAARAAQTDDGPTDP